MNRKQRQSKKNQSSRVPRKVNPAVTKLFRGMAFVLAACGIMGCAYLVLEKASRPFLISYAESREIAVISREKAAAENDNRRLKEEKEYLLTARGKEAEARKLGWVRDGEVAIVVEQPDRPDVSDAEVTIERKPKRESRWHSLGQRVLSKFLFGSGKSASAANKSPSDAPLD